MTKKVFWENPYLTNLETSIHRVEGDLITLEETIFYALSGGQESDHGTIGGFDVLHAEKRGHDIFYTVEKGHTLRVGDRVQITIDWERRYKLMRLHFAAEVVLELVSQMFPHMIKVGAHIAPEKARIDFTSDESVTPLLPSLEKAAQHIIDSNQEIVSAFSDEINERRYWKIREFAEVPCGGTHVRKTGEIGNIRLKRVNPGKGRERIEIYATIG